MSEKKWKAIFNIFWMKKRAKNTTQIIFNFQRRERKRKWIIQICENSWIKIQWIKNVQKQKCAKTKMCTSTTICYQAIAKTKLVYLLINGSKISVALCSQFTQSRFWCDNFLFGSSLIFQLLPVCITYDCECKFYHSRLW